MQLPGLGGLAARGVVFDDGVAEAGRQEWFMAGTAPAGSGLNAGTGTSKTAA